MKSDEQHRHLVILVVAVKAFAGSAIAHPLELGRSLADLAGALRRLPEFRRFMCEASAGVPKTPLSVCAVCSHSLPRRSQTRPKPTAASSPEATPPPRLALRTGSRSRQKVDLPNARASRREGAIDGSPLLVANSGAGGLRAHSEPVRGVELRVRRVIPTERSKGHSESRRQPVVSIARSATAARRGLPR